MAQPTMMKTTELGERCRAARKAKGLSVLDAMTEIRQRLPRSMWVTDVTIRRIENGTTPEEKADPVLLATMAAAYGVKVSDLSPLAAAGIQTIFADVFGALQPQLVSEQEGDAGSAFTIW